MQALLLQRAPTNQSTDPLPQAILQNNTHPTTAKRTARAAGCLRLPFSYIPRFDNVHLRHTACQLGQAHPLRVMRPTLYNQTRPPERATHSSRPLLASTA